METIKVVEKLECQSAKFNTFNLGASTSKTDNEKGILPMLKDKEPLTDTGVEQKV